MDRKQNNAFVKTMFEGDNHKMFLTKLRHRFDRAGVEIPKIEVRYENLSVEGNVHIGGRARSTLLNATINLLEAITEQVKLAPSRKRTLKILQNVSGIVKPSRMTLVLGPPSSGKTTLLLALAGKLEKNDVKVSGTITYNGEDFVPKRTCAYISQNDLHYGEMTVRETLVFSRQFLGVGSKKEMLNKVLEEENRLGKIEVDDVELDAFMKAITSIEGQNAAMITDYMLQILGLDMCADTIVGDDMRRGISGGEKKRLTIGEMLVGPASLFLMDGISTGLDSATTFRICKCISEMVHIMDITTVISLLQPTPETYELFDDIILLSEGQIVYQGQRDRILDFFEYVGFKCPQRKAVADFLQEVTSIKDQEQYWSKTDQPYEYISVSEFVQSFQSFNLGQVSISDLRIPYKESKSTSGSHSNADTYEISKWKILRTCFAREWLLMRRNAFLYIFKSVQMTIMAMATLTAFFRTTMRHETTLEGEKYFGAVFMSLTNFMFNGMAETTLTIMGLGVFYKQRDSMFYPAWAYALPVWILRIPISILESTIWVLLTYYTIGYAPSAHRFFSQWLALMCIHQMTLAIFRFVGAVGRTDVVANAINMICMLIVLVLCGFIVAKDDLGPWIKWGYYLSPLTYGENALVVNEFLDERWSTPNTDLRIKEPTVGQVVLASRDFFDRNDWYWICIVALLGYSIFFNLLFIAALTYLNPIRDAKAAVQLDDDDSKAKITKIFSTQVRRSKKIDSRSNENINSPKMGMVLPFKPLSLSFNHINYYVDTPSEMKSLGYTDDRLQLLQDVSGAFKPGILTALVGVTGAGKTTLMDVLSGRKTCGYIDGTITVSGYPKNQATFARICGYCEQADVHSPNVTVYESLLYSAWLRLSSDTDEITRQMFVVEVMKLIELEQLKDAIVGLPGKSGLSCEQRKRLTIAVELVANPSIIFMDEPTSGLDARAAAIVMRTVRNTVNTGRTIVCTIHQPSIDIFESFDELLLMKSGGRLTYAGPLGRNSHKLVEYFEAIPGVPKIKQGDNPATWMLDITSPQMELELNLDYAEIYTTSSAYKKNQEVIEGISTPLQGSEDIYFPTKYTQPFSVQFRACFWKQHRSYWQNPSYNGVRFFMMTTMGVALGVMFWNRGTKLATQKDLMNFMGVLFSSLLVLGPSNALNVQVVVASERTVLNRERAAGMYSVLSFALAQLIIEMIYLAIGSFVYTILMYSMIGFEWTFTKCFYFYYYIYICFLYYSVFGMMLISLTSRPEISAMLMTFSVSMWNLFGGFLLPKTQIPIWWRWYYWGSPVAWTMYGLVTSQVGENTSLIQVPQVGNVPLNTYLTQLFGYDYDFLPFIAIGHLGWVLLFFVVFAYAIRVLNFQKR